MSPSLFITEVRVECKVHPLIHDAPVRFRKSPVCVKYRSKVAIPHLLQLCSSKNSYKADVTIYTTKLILVQKSELISRRWGGSERTALAHSLSMPVLPRHDDTEPALREYAAA